MRYYVVDAFAERVFEGNPAGVCVLDKWLPDWLMQAVANENNLAETAFAVKAEAVYHLRWFTPGGEIDLCGHATLATAYVLLRFFEPEADRVVFQTKSGTLEVVRSGERLEMDFPAYPLTRVEVTDAMAEAIGVRPAEAWMGRDLVCVLEDEAQVRALRPDQEKVRALDGLLLHVTAKGDAYDCVSRTFAPKMGVAEDAVCGSGHCHIIPLWAQKEGKVVFTAYQASQRGGTLYCRKRGDRVKLAGNAVLYSEAELFIDGLIRP